MPGARQQQLQDESRLATNSRGDLIYLILPIIHRDFRTTFKVNMSPAKKFCWRMRASIPLPRACKARALPFELIPRRLFGFAGIRYFIFSSILNTLHAGLLSTI